MPLWSADFIEYSAEEPSPALAQASLTVKSVETRVYVTPILEYPVFKDLVSQSRPRDKCRQGSSKVIHTAVHDGDLIVDLRLRESTLLCVRGDDMHIGLHVTSGCDSKVAIRCVRSKCVQHCFLCDSLAYVLTKLNGPREDGKGSPRYCLPAFGCHDGLRQHCVDQQVVQWL